jgi:hypothetical protein
LVDALISAIALATSDSWPSQTDDYFSVASHTSDFEYYASVEGNRSDLGLQTHGYSAFTNLQYNPSGQDAVSFVAQLRQDVYQIPNCTAPLPDDPQCVGQFGDVQGGRDRPTAAAGLGAERLLGQVLPGPTARDALGALGRLRNLE